MDTIHIQSGKTQMVAHRGVSGLERENTAAAFVAAGNRSYWGIETDVHRTRDGQFVCIHDRETGRVGIDNLDVEKSTFDTLRSLVLTDMDGTRSRLDLRIPSLREYVSILKRYGKMGVLELKSDFTDDELRKIIGIINDEDYLDGIVFISFRLDNMKGIRAILPDQPCQYLTDQCGSDIIETLKDLNIDLDIAHHGLTKERLDILHAAGIKVNVWTVDNAEDAGRYVSWGVDYITSNILE